MNRVAQILTLSLLFGVLILVLSRSRSHGQLGGVQQPIFGNPSGWTPRDIGGLTFWWVASDLPDGNVITWTDRVANFVLTASPTRPVKSGDYVAFAGASYVTNRLVDSGRLWIPWSFYFVVAASNYPAGNYMQLGPWIAGFGSQLEFWDSLRNWYFRNVSSILSRPVQTNNVVVDYGFATYKSGATGIAHTWTNGLATSDTTGDIADSTSPAISLGGGTSGENLRGRIYEWLVWTNHTLTSEEITNPHNFMKSRYTIDP